jgi:hypothetical protein
MTQKHQRASKIARHTKITGGGFARGQSNPSNDVADPCPWCGSHDLVATPNKRVVCCACDAMGPSPVDKNFVNRNNAIALWNRRRDRGSSTN